VEEPLRARSRPLRLVLIGGIDEPDPVTGSAQHVRAEESPAPAREMQSIVDLRRSRSVDGEETSRQLVLLAVRDVRTLLEPLCSFRRPDLHTEQMSICPRRALVARAGQTDRLDLPQTPERRARQRQRIDQNRLPSENHGMRIAPVIDPVVMEMPVEDPRRD